MGWLGLSYEEHHKDVERFVSKISLQSNSQEDLFAVIYCYMCSTGNPLNARTLKELSHAACQSISKHRQDKLHTQAAHRQDFDTYNNPRYSASFLREAQYIKRRRIPRYEHSAQRLL